MKIVYAFVVMDLPHWGHMLFLKRAGALGDFLVVGVLDDDTVESYKRRPIMSLEERMKIISRIKGVDLVIPQFERFPLENLKTLHRFCPTDKLIVAHGTDWKKEIFAEVIKYLDSINGELELLPFYKRQSTTSIIDKIKRRYNAG